MTDLEKPKKRPRLNDPTFIHVRLRHHVADSLLVDPVFLQVHSIKFVTSNRDRNAYLVHLCALIFDIHLSDINLFRKADGSDGPDDDRSWEEVTNESPIRGGTYIADIISDDLRINVDPIAIARGRRPKSKNSSRQTSARQTRENTPSKKLNHSRNNTPSNPQSHQPTSLERNLALIAPVSLTAEQTLDEVEILDSERLGISNRTRIRMSMLTDNDYSKGVIERDMTCRIWEMPAGSRNFCSHIVPRALIVSKSLYGTPFSANGITFADPNEPVLGILLSPDCDRYFNAFELSACTMDDTFEVMCFRSPSLPDKRSFAIGAWLARGMRLLVNGDHATMKALIRWHEKHCVVNAWGSAELRSKLRDFEDADMVGVASMYNLDDDSDVPSSISADDLFY